MKQKGQSRIKNIHIDDKIAKICLHTTQPKQIVVLREKSLKLHGIISVCVQKNFDDQQIRDRTYITHIFISKQTMPSSVTVEFKDSTGSFLGQLCTSHRQSSSLHPAKFTQQSAVICS